MLSQRPNVLMLYTDQQRADAMRCAGNDEIYTPNLDRLASKGVRFSQHFCNAPVCMPSRVSMLSGRYPHDLRILANGTPVPEDVVTLPTILSRQGYYTANIGKLHFVTHANRDYRQPHPAYGFDHLEISDEPGPYDDAYRAFVRQRMPDQLEHISRFVYPPASRKWREIVGLDEGIEHPDMASPWVPRVFTGEDEATHTAFVGQRTCEFLASRSGNGQPFFCISGFYSPHSPLFAPKQYFDLYERDKLKVPGFPSKIDAQRKEAGQDDDMMRAAKHGYYAMVSEVDHWVGRILDQLESQGLADNTIVVFISDHGEFLGEFMRWGKGRPEDCSSRVPLIIRNPLIDTATEGQVCDALVESVDVLPTLLEACAVPTPPWTHGQSLIGALKGESGPSRQHVLIEQDDWKALRDKTHRYVLHEDGREALYDVTTPLGEYTNLAEDPQQQSLLAEFRLALSLCLMQTQRRLPRVWPY